MIDGLIRAHGRRLWGLCRTLCRGALDAEALYQDTWLAALTHFAQYDPALPFEPWLTRICVNTYKNALRRLRRSPVFDGFATADEKAKVLEAVAAPCGADSTECADLHAAIECLPERLRVTVILYYFHDLDIAAVARTLGIPPGTVKSRLSMARARLKEMLSDDADL